MNLQLSLKTKWFEMTKEGVKTEDYRDINDYWFKRLVYDYKKVFKYTTGYDWDSLDKQSINVLLSRITADKHKRRMVGFKPFSTNTMTLGYPKKTDTARVLKLEHKGIVIDWGKAHLGGDTNKLYFVVKHGKRVT